MTAYTTWAVIKNIAKITYDLLGFASDADAQTWFENTVLPIVSGYIDEYCMGPGAPSGFFYTSGGVTITSEYYDSNGIGRFFTKYRPIVSVTSLYTTTDEPGATRTWNLLVEGDDSGKHFYVEDSKAGIICIFDETYIPSKEVKRSIKMTYKVGYATIPGTVQAVVWDVCAAYLRDILKRKINPNDITAAIAEGQDVQVFVENLRLTSAQKEMLRPFMRYIPGSVY